MNRRLFGTLGALATLVLTAAAAGGCKSDPLSDLDGKPAGIVKQFSQMTVAAGDSSTFTASVVDGRLTPLAESITFTTSGTGFTAGADGSYNPQPPTSARAKVRGTGTGTGFVIIQGGGLRDSVEIIVP
jgi:hypothetical protein